MPQHPPARQSDALPFHLLAVAPGDLAAPSRPFTLRAADDLSAAMARLGQQVTLETPNHLVLRGDPLRDTLALDDPDVFTPAGLAGAVRLFGEGVALRDALRDALASGGGGEAVLEAYSGLTALTDAARSAIAQAGDRTAAPAPAPTPEVPPASDAGDLDRLFEIVDAPAADTPPPDTGARLLRQFLNHGAGRRKPADAAPVAAVDALLGRQLAAILRTPALRAAETFWLGLRRVVEATDFRGGDRITVVRLPRDETGAHLRKLDIADEAAVSAILVDAQLGHATRDMVWLAEVAEAAEDRRAPAVLGLAPGFFDAEVLPADLPYPRTVLDNPRYDAWHAFRAKPASRWAAVTLNRPLLREPRAGTRRSDLGLAEPVGGRADLCWGNPAWLVAAAMARSAAATGWPTEITGQGNAATPDLSLAPWDADDPDSPQIPLETLLDADACRDLAACGIVPLSCRRNRDTAFLAQAPLAHRPEIYGDAAMTAASRAMATLPYQLGAARLLAELDALLGGIGAIDADAAQRLALALNHRLGDAARVRAGLDPDPDRADGNLLRLDVQLGRDRAGGARYGFAIPV